MNNVIKKLLTILFVGCSAFFILAHAALSDPMDPRAMANLPIEQQIQAHQDIAKQLLSATPEERKAYSEKRHQIMSKMTLGELEELHKQKRAQWQSLTPEQKTKIKADRKAFYESLTPEQKKAMKTMRKHWKHHHGCGKGHGNWGGHGEWSEHGGSHQDHEKL